MPPSSTARELIKGSPNGRAALSPKASSTSRSVACPPLNGNQPVALVKFRAVVKSSNPQPNRSFPAPDFLPVSVKLSREKV